VATRDRGTFDGRYSQDVWALTLTFGIEQTVDACLVDLRAWLTRLWSGAFYSAFVERGDDGRPHAHLVLGGLAYTEMKLRIATWPWRTYLKRCWDSYGWLHYSSKDIAVRIDSPDLAKHWRSVAALRGQLSPAQLYARASKGGAAAAKALGLEGRRRRARKGGLASGVVRATRDRS
jgi:hypothetical protein